MDKTYNSEKEHDFFVRYTNIDRLYTYYDNLLRSAEGNYRYNEIADESQKKTYRKKCSLLNRMKLDLIKGMDSYYLGEAVLDELKTDNIVKETVVETERKEDTSIESKPKEKTKKKK